MRNPASTSAAASRSSRFVSIPMGRAGSPRSPRRMSARRFAFFLDNSVVRPPIMREPITSGAGQISGSFTVEAANNLAILLRAGALPAKLTVIEQRVVGAGLGQDSIEKGKLASYYGFALVVVFMVVTYGLFGVF